MSDGEGEVVSVSTGMPDWRRFARDDAAEAERAILRLSSHVESISDRAERAEAARDKARAMALEQPVRILGEVLALFYPGRVEGASRVASAVMLDIEHAVASLTAERDALRAERDGALEVARDASVRLEMAAELAAAVVRADREAAKALARLQVAMMAAGKAGLDAPAVATLLETHAPEVYRRIVAGQGAEVVADVLRGKPALPQTFIMERAKQRSTG